MKSLQEMYIIVSPTPLRDVNHVAHNIVVAIKSDLIPKSRKKKKFLD